MRRNFKEKLIDFCQQLLFWIFIILFLSMIQGYWDYGDPFYVIKELPFALYDTIIIIIISFTR